MLMPEVAVSEERTVSPRVTGEEGAHRVGQWPRTLQDFVGQRNIKESVALSIEAAKARAEALGHILVCGPEGCGKKTLALTIADEMGVKLTVTSGQAVERSSDLPAILTNLGQRDILFVDDIQGLRRGVEERLCQAMKNYALDIVIGKGPSAKPIHLPLPHITVIGAADQRERVSYQLSQRFTHIYEFEPYGEGELARLVEHRAKVLEVKTDEEACWRIARGAKGDVREAQRLLDLARDYATVRADGTVTLDAARWAVEGRAPTSDTHEAELMGLTWQEFEGFMARVFKTLGHRNVRLTPRAGDEGKDIVMEWADPLRGTRRIYVECKHWKAIRWAGGQFRFCTPPWLRTHRSTRESW